MGHGKLTTGERINPCSRITARDEKEQFTPFHGQHTLHPMFYSDRGDRQLGASDCPKGK